MNTLYQGEVLSLNKYLRFSLGLMKGYIQAEDNCQLSCLTAGTAIQIPSKLAILAGNDISNSTVSTLDGFLWAIRQQAC